MTDVPPSNSREFIDEIEHGSGDYTDVELLDQAQLNAQALLLGTVDILRDNPAALESWRDGLAAIFIRGWDAEREWSANEILDALLTNYRSFGAVVVDHVADSDDPSATMSGLPDTVLVEELRLDPEHIQQLLMIGKAIAGSLGGVLAWTIEPGTGDIALTVRLPEVSS